jgi:DnaJ domain
MSKKEDDKKKTGKGFLSLWFSPADEVVNRLATELEENRAKLSAGENSNGEPEENGERQNNDDSESVDLLATSATSANLDESDGDEANGKITSPTLGNEQTQSPTEDNRWAQPEAQSQKTPVSTGETEEDTRTQEGFQRYLHRFDFYELLQIDPGASTEQIHKSYLRRVRNLIGSHEVDSKLEPWQVERLVQAISLAHEVLRDQNTRSSYDKNRNFRKFVSEDQEYEPVRRRANSGKSIHSLISLIRYSQLLTPTDLDAALAVNQGKTELQIASYLVDVGRLTVEELESITLARYLIALGKITITQYEIIIGEMKETGTPLWVGLVAKGWVKMTDVLSN